MVYEIICQDCEGTHNNTTEYLYGRYKSLSNKVRNNEVEPSALAEHSLKKIHHFDFQNFRVCVSESDDQRSAVLELLHIETSNASTNDSNDNNVNGIT